MVFLRLPQGFQGAAKVENHCTKVTDPEENLGQEYSKSGEETDGTDSKCKGPR